MSAGQAAGSGRAVVACALASLQLVGCKAPFDGVVEPDGTCVVDHVAPPGMVVHIPPRDEGEWVLELALFVCAERVRMHFADPQVLRDRLIVASASSLGYQDDADGDGANFTLESDDESVLDATGLAPDSCAIELSESRLRLGGFVLRYPVGVHPICDYGFENDWAGVQLEEVP